MTPAAARFRDRRAIIVWAFALAWDAAVALLWAVVWAEGGGAKGWLAVAIFALAGAGLSAFALRAPVIAVHVQPGGVTVTRRYPHARRRHVWRLTDVRGATVIEDGDTDSGPSYICRIEVQRGDPIDLYGKARREDAEAEAARFNAALDIAAGRTPAHAESIDVRRRP